MSSWLHFSVAGCEHWLSLTFDAGRGRHWEKTNGSANFNCGTIFRKFWWEPLFNPCCMSLLSSLLNPWSFIDLQSMHRPLLFIFVNCLTCFIWISVNLQVRRSNLVQDSLHQLAEQQFYLKKPLKVYFFFFYVLFGEGVTLFHTMEMRIFALTVVLLLVFMAQFGSNHLC
jgi:hypothetical protein